MNVQDSLSQDAAWPGHSLAQVHSTFIFNPIGRQINDLQGRVVLQHLGEKTQAVTSHTVTAGGGTVDRERWILKHSLSIQRIGGISQRNTSCQILCEVADVLFLPAQVQVAQAVVEQQAFSQPLHPGVGHPHLPQVELHQAAVQHQHLREVHRPLLLQTDRETSRSESNTRPGQMFCLIHVYLKHHCDALCVWTWWLKSSGRLMSTE